MSSKNQSGFSIALVAIIAVLVVSVIGFISWNSYHQPQKQEASITPSNSNTNIQPSKAIMTSVTTTSAGTYLDIKELGIKIKLDDSIKDTTYTVKTDTDGSQFAYISTQALTNSSKGTCGADKGSFASITKATGTPQQVFLKATAPVDNSTVFKFGSNTYIFITRPQYACSQDTTASNLFSKQQATFFNDFKTVQPDQ